VRRPPLAGPGEVNYSFVDRFTLVHATFGAGYAFLGLSFAVAVILALAWELVEDPLKAHLPVFFPHATGDRLRNAVGDFLAVLGGWFIVRYWVQG